MPDETPPAGPNWSQLAAKQRLRPLSATALTVQPPCVWCGAATVKCCDGTLGGEPAWFVPICEGCFAATSPPPAPES